MNLSRAEACAKLLEAGGFFASDVSSILQPQRGYSLKTSTGQEYSGRVQFVRALRGFCLSVRELNDALVWVTIEGPRERIEVQIGLSAFTLSQGQIEKFEKRWSAQLQNLFS